MVGRDVRQDGDVRTEALDRLELEGGKLADEVAGSAVAEEPRKRRADVSGEGDRPLSEAQDLGDPRGRRGLAVRTGHGHPAVRAGRLKPATLLRTE